MTPTQQNTASAARAAQFGLVSPEHVVTPLRNVGPDVARFSLSAWVKAVSLVARSPVRVPASPTSRLALPNSNCGRGLFCQVAA